MFVMSYELIYFVLLLHTYYLVFIFTCDILYLSYRVYVLHNIDTFFYSITNYKHKRNSYRPFLQQFHICEENVGGWNSMKNMIQWFFLFCRSYIYVENVLKQTFSLRLFDVFPYVIYTRRLCIRWNTVGYSEWLKKRVSSLWCSL